MHHDHNGIRLGRYFVFDTAKGTPNEIVRMRGQPLWIAMSLNIGLREFRFRFNQKRKISRIRRLEQCRLVQRRFGVLPEFFDFILEE